MRLHLPSKPILRSPWFRSPRHPVTEEEINQRALQLSESRPWCNAEENLIDAKQELEGPHFMRWRPTLLRWLGASEKTGWEWMELSLKFSLPLTIAILGGLLSKWNDERQTLIADNSRKDVVLNRYMENMQTLILEKGLQEGPYGVTSVVARTLTLVTLSQLSSPGETRRRSVLQFLRESRVINTEASKVFLLDADFNGANLSDVYLKETNLSGANFNKANLRGANLENANLRAANLINTDLSEADLSGADLSHTNLARANFYRANLNGTKIERSLLIGANLRGADLRGSSLQGSVLYEIQWDRTTKWPERELLENVKGLPFQLKRQLGLLNNPSIKSLIHASKSPAYYSRQP